MWWTQCPRANDHERIGSTEATGNVRDLLSGRDAVCSLLEYGDFLRRVDKIKGRTCKYIWWLQIWDTKQGHCWLSLIWWWNERFGDGSADIEGMSMNESHWHWSFVENGTKENNKTIEDIKSYTPFLFRYKMGGVYPSTKLFLTEGISLDILHDRLYRPNGWTFCRGWLVDHFALLVECTFFIFSQIAIAIAVLTSNRGGGRRTTLADWTWRQVALEGAVVALRVPS